MSARFIKAGFRGSFQLASEVHRGLMERAWPRVGERARPVDEGFGSCETGSGAGLAEGGDFVGAGVGAGCGGRARASGGSASWLDQTAFGRISKRSALV